LTSHFHFTIAGLQRLRSAGLNTRYCIEWFGGASLASAMHWLQTASSSEQNPAASCDGPLFILGHWRSGTTLLQELLSLNPAFCTPNTYECLYPYHFELTERALSRVGRLRRPAPRPMDGMPVSLDSPQEDEFALLSIGAISMYRWMILPSQFQACLRDLDPSMWTSRDTEEWKKTFLQFVRQIQSLRPGLVLLKSPPHQFRIPLLRQIFPNARFIHLVRDPARVFSSSINLWRDMFTIHATEPFAHVNIAECVLRIGEVQERLVFPEIASLPAEVCCRVRFEDLVKAPLEILAMLHETMKIPWSEQYARGVLQYLQSRDAQKTKATASEVSIATEHALRNRWPLAYLASGF
jgi:omega-hydroxy-beta-dihydromenaquinone-9 sulfotransferase